MCTQLVGLYSLLALNGNVVLSQSYCTLKITIPVLPLEAVYIWILQFQQTLLINEVNSNFDLNEQQQQQQQQQQHRHCSHKI